MASPRRTSNDRMLNVQIATHWRRCGHACSLLSFAIACSSSSEATGGTVSDGGVSEGGQSAIVEEGGTLPDGTVLGADGATAVPGTPESVCRDAVLTFCARRHHCSPLIEAEEADCRAFADLCPAYYFDSSDRTVEEVAACTAKIRQVSCTDLALDYVEPCNKPGQRAMGQPCVYSGQCATGVCTGGITRCGQCGQPAVLEVDATCSTLRDVPCPSGTFCHPVSKKCRAGSTIVHGGPGAMCNLQADPILGCEGDLYCVVPQGGTTGICRPSGTDGQPCRGDASPRCAEGLECVQMGTTNVCRREGLCGDTVCDTASYCNTNLAKEVCAPAAKVGEACGSLTPDNRECDSTSVCYRNPDGQTFSCQKQIGGEIGDMCTDSNGCRRPFPCTGGMCTPFAIDQCVPK
jgi:hypothetical protein